MGRAWKEMMPHTKSTSAAPRIMRRLRRAKSMRARIILLSAVASQYLFPRHLFLLRHIVGELQRVGVQFVAGLHAITNFLHSVGRETVGLNDDLAKVVCIFSAKDPVFIVQAHDGGGGNDHAFAALARTERGYSEHAGPECAVGVGKHDANLGGTRVGIEHA